MADNVHDEPRDEIVSQGGQDQARESGDVDARELPAFAPATLDRP